MERELLPSLPIFEGLPDSELDALAEAVWTIELERGQSLANEGEFGHTLFFVEQGTADIVRDGNVHAIVGPGDVVGEIAVLGCKRSWTAAAATWPSQPTASARHGCRTGRGT